MFLITAARSFKRSDRLVLWVFEAWMPKQALKDGLTAPQ